MPNFTGKVSIITGSSSGIGQVAAVLFAKLGSAVVITGRKTEGLEETKKQCLQHTTDDKVHVVAGDLTEIAVIKRLRDETIAKFGKIDILINNAGTDSPDDGTAGPIEAFDFLMNINLRCVVQLTMTCMPDLIATKGAIVMCSSILSSVAWTHFVYYGMAKAGLDHYTRCLAVEYGRHGVRVNSVNPGIIKTQIFERIGCTTEQVDQWMNAVAKDYPLRRVGECEDVANLMAFLASEDAAFISGEHIHVDGGYHRVPPRHDLLFEEMCDVKRKEL